MIFLNDKQRLLKIFPSVIKERGDFMYIYESNMKLNSLSLYSQGGGAYLAPPLCQYAQL